MTHEDTIDLINEIERRFPVEEYKAGDHYFWPILRIRMAFAMILHSNSAEKIASPAHQPVSVLSKLSGKINFWYDRIIRRRAKSRRYFAKMNKRTDILHFSFTSIRTLVNDKWYNKQVDPIIDHTRKNGLSSLLLEVQNEVKYLTPRYNEHECVEIDSAISSFVNSRIDNTPDPFLFLPGYDEMLSFFKERTPAQIHNTVSHVSIKELSKRYLLINDFFKAHLLKLKPRVCFISCYYDLRAMALCAACKEIGIKTIELQHGVQGDNHIAYGRWLKVPAKGYEAIPDRFWCWSKDDVISIAKWGGEYHKGFPGGNAWIDMWKMDDSPIVRSYDRKISSLNTGKQIEKNILCTIQPLPNAIPTELIEAVKKSPPGWKWWFRLHPRQINQQQHYNDLLGGQLDSHRFNLTDATLLPLPALLRHTDVHLTHSSSSVLEAEEFSIPSVLTSMHGFFLYPRQVREGIAVHAEMNAQTILEAISRQLSFRFNTDKQKFHFGSIIDDLLKERTIN